TVPGGVVRAVEYRLRRIAGALPDPPLMPVVETGAMAPPAPNGTQTKVIIDNGRTTFGPGDLLDWARYQWVAEVRGAPEPGGGPPAHWSSPSVPVSLMFVPKDPPRPAVLTAVFDATHVNLSWTHPDPLRGGQVGDYRVELYRRLRGKPDQLAFSLS